MAFARDSYTASSSQTDFTISFAYLQESHVVVTKNGSELTQGSSNDYTFFDSSTIRLNSGATTGDVIVITRKTSRGSRLTDYTPGPLTEAGLDNDSLQAFYMAQEAIDQAEIRLGLDNNDEWDAESKPINNVTDPTDDQDAATKNYVDAQITGSGNVPAPADPGDDNKVLEANSGSFAWTAKDTAGDGIDRSSDTLSVDLASNPGLEFATAKLRAKIADSTITRDSSGLAVNVGTGANQIVQLDGSALLPAVDGSQLTNLPVSDVQEFDASGTWNKPSSGTVAIIEAWGGGGSGGHGDVGTAGGGGGGGYAQITMPLSALGSSETVTIGAGGASVTSTDTDGNAGGNTTFGSHLTAYGGGGGAFRGGDNAGGGGGGGWDVRGTSAAGSTGSGATGGAGGGMGGASGGTDTNDGDSTTDHLGGAGGGGAGGTGGDALWGGAGGGGGASGGGVAGSPGGDTFMGGGGGGGSAYDDTPGAGAGGTSSGGGDGGAGGEDDEGDAVAGTQPGGGGGGSHGGNSGAGGAGRVRVTVI